MSIIDKAKTEGFEVVDENGVLYVLMNPETYFNKRKYLEESRRFRNFIKREEYLGSYGFRPVRKETTDNNG